MTDKATPNPLEQFVLLAKTAKGAGAVELIKQALEAQGVYVFGELLDMPHIQEVCLSYCTISYFINCEFNFKSKLKLSLTVNSLCITNEIDFFQLASGAHSQYFDLLNIFAYGCYKDYKGTCISLFINMLCKHT